MKLEDVRMKGFKHRTSFEDAFKLITSIIKTTDSEYMSIENSPKRVLYEDIISTVNVPDFNRSCVDGYALRASETYGASHYNPIALKITGEALAGEHEAGIKKREALRIMTGAKMPQGADACIMAEYTEEKDRYVLIHKPVSGGENVSKIGEDIKKGSSVLKKGRVIKPYDTGILASMQVRQIRVYKKPTVDIIITGSELVEPGKKPKQGQIIDSNTYILEALLKDTGAILSSKKRVPDDYKKIKKEIQACKSDIIIVTAGTSCGKKDYAPLIVNETGKLLVHGISMKPAGPTGIGVISKKPVFLLPGNPQAVCIAYDFFVRYALTLMQGIKNHHETTALGTLTKKTASAIGRTDIFRVKYNNAQVEPIRSGGASILSSMVRADAYLVVPENIDGYPQGREVKVRLF